MMEKEPGTSGDLSLGQVIESGLSDLESQRLELEAARSEAGEEEEEINNVVAKEVPEEGGREESEQKVTEGDQKKGEEVVEEQPSTPPTTISRPLTRVLEAGQPSLTSPTSTSSRHYA